MNLKVIFLDIDGVLNSATYYKKVARNVPDWDRFDPSVVKMIKELVEQFSVKLVISSTWRFGAVSLLEKELKKSGLIKHLHQDWKTPLTHPSHRGDEIDLWLKSHPEIINYVILDDEINITEKQKSNYVRTYLETGFLKKHFEKAKQILLKIK